MSSFEAQPQALFYLRHQFSRNICLLNNSNVIMRVDYICHDIFVVQMFVKLLKAIIFVKSDFKTIHYRENMYNEQVNDLRVSQNPSTQLLIS